MTASLTSGSFLTAFVTNHCLIFSCSTGDMTVPPCPPACTNGTPSSFRSLADSTALTATTCSIRPTCARRASSVLSSGVRGRVGSCRRGAIWFKATKKVMMAVRATWRSWKGRYGFRMLIGSGKGRRASGLRMVGRTLIAGKYGRVMVCSSKTASAANAIYRHCRETDQLQLALAKSFKYSHIFRN